MSDGLSSILPVPPALVYLLHQLKVNGIGYLLYGQIPDTDMVFVDLARDYACNLNANNMPEHWSVVSPHYLTNRALKDGQEDPIQKRDSKPEAIVLAYGEKEARQTNHFRALCEQVSFLRQHGPSRLVYHNAQPPQPVEIHQLIAMLKANHC
jgi:hypothetical protein